MQEHRKRRCFAVCAAQHDGNPLLCYGPISYSLLAARYPLITARYFFPVVV
jgi:hypothetical protein